MRRVLLAIALLGAAFVGAPGSARAQVPQVSQAPEPPGGSAGSVPPVDVIEVIGRLDGIEADFIERSVRAAAANGSQLLLIQLDSPGPAMSTARLDRVVEAIAEGGVPVAVWVGTSGARAYGPVVRLLRAAAVSGMANGAHVGRFDGPCPECRPSDPLAGGRRFNATDAQAAQAVDIVSPTLGDFLVEMDGREVGGRTLDTAEVVEREGQPRREPVAQVRFAKINLVERALHATSSPSVAYLLLVLGVLLMVFEFYSVGIGVAGLIGAASIALAAYGLGALGATPVGLLLLALSAFGYSVDVQAGVARIWTGVATAAFVLGSWLLFPSDRRVPVVVLVLILAGTLLFMLRAMPTMVRTRFSTATIDRDGFVGEVAEAVTALAPEGTVRLHGGLWKARAAAAAAAHISPGQAVRVVAIDGIVIEVEPDDGLASGGG